MVEQNKQGAGNENDFYLKKNEHGYEDLQIVQDSPWRSHSNEFGKVDGGWFTIEVEKLFRVGLQKAFRKGQEEVRLYTLIVVRNGCHTKFWSRMKKLDISLKYRILSGLDMKSAMISPFTEISNYFHIFHRYFGDIPIFFQFIGNIADLIGHVSTTFFYKKAQMPRELIQPAHLTQFKPPTQPRESCSSL